MLRAVPMSSRNTTRMSDDDYKWLGRILTRLRPDIVQELTETYYSEGTKPEETDLQKIKTYYDAFCRLEGVSPSEQRGLMTRRGTDLRRFFIAAMLHLYRPKSFLAPQGRERFYDGLNQEFAHTLGVRPYVITRTIQQVIVWQKVDDDFNLRVAGILSQLQTFNN